MDICIESISDMDAKIINVPESVSRNFSLFNSRSVLEKIIKYPIVSVFVRIMHMIKLFKSYLQWQTISV